MTTSPFIWLGSKRAKKAGVGNKGTLLDYAAKMGLPVPNGGILLHEFYLFALENNLIRTTNGLLFAPDPSLLAKALFDDFRFPRLDAPLAIRSAFSAEDTSSQSMAGQFETKLGVLASDVAKFASSLCEVWSSAERHDAELRRDVLIMTMVAAQQSGVAFSEAAYADDLINLTSGTADQLVAGLITGKTMLLPQLHHGEWPTAAEPFAQRLQLLLRGIRRTFGPGNSATSWRGDWDIEWADDGKICWLVQMRPATRPTRRNEAFTFANFREILPDPPSPMMGSTVMASAPDLFSYYRRFDPTLPTQRSLIEQFAGRPLFNISLLTDVMRHWGLPTRLVTNAIGGSSDVEVGFRLGRFLYKTPVLLRQGVAQLRAVSLAKKRAADLIHQAGAIPSSGDSFAAATDAFCSIFTGFVQEMFNLTAALSAPLLILRNAGTLEEHSTRQKTMGTRLLTDLDELRAYVVAQPHLQPALLEGTLPDDAGFQKVWQTFLEQHGHRGVYESDIAQPRYVEAPESLLQSLAYPSRGRTPTRSRTLKGWLTLPVWWQCGRVLRAREQFRYDIMKAYQIMRGRLLALAQQAVTAQQLPDETSLWLLTREEAAQLDEGHIFDLDFLAQRRHEIEAREQYVLPDLIHRFDNLELYRSHPGETAGDGPLTGVSLTVGQVRGRAWVLHKPEHRLPGGFTPENTVLIARSVDAGWIPTFRQVAGVVVDIGGDLSHGSIILREIGLPAITNCGRATQTFQTGDEVELDAGRGQVVRLQLQRGSP